MPGMSRHTEFSTTVMDQIVEIGGLGPQGGGESFVRWMEKVDRKENRLLRYFASCTCGEKK